MIDLIVNGKQSTVDAHTIAELIAHYGLTGKPIVVEADGEIVDRALWKQAELRQNMKLELVHFVGGG